MNPIRFFLPAFLLAFTCCLHAQFAIGPKFYTRLTDDHVGPTTGYGLHAVGLIYEADVLYGIAGGGFDISIPQTFNGRASMNAKDSAMIPFTITVPADLKVTDYVFHLDIGIAINPKHKTHAWVATIGLRGIYRNVQVDYKQSFNENAYDRYSLKTNPRIPAALNVGFDLGVGYMYRYKWLGIYSQASFGFGSNDHGHNHPWNMYPNYLEVSVTFLAITKHGE